MRRFFVPKEAVNNGEIIIKGQLAHHISRVLRLQEGEEITVAVENGEAYYAKLSAFGSDWLKAEILQSLTKEQETKVQVTLYQGLPKGDKLEWIIQKCTELGVVKIVPVIMERTVVKLEPQKAQKKQERWQKIAHEAAQQSKRLSIPEITLPISFEELLTKIEKEAFTILLWEDEKTLRLKTLLEKETEPERINIIIGPEGGLDAAEVERLREKGAVSATLGKRILRTETAGMAALTMILYHTGDLG